MKIFNSSFQEAPFSKEAEDKACLHADNIMDEAGDFVMQEMRLDKEGKLIWEVSEGEYAFDDEVGEVVRDNLQNLIDIIRGRVDSIMAPKLPFEIIFLSEYLEKGKEEESEINVWHHDGDGHVFVAFGDIANIECITGMVQVREVGDWRDERELTRQTVRSLDRGEVISTAIPNNVPVIMDGQTIHRKSPKNRKEGLRFSVNLHYE